jgi:hypothetical protein
MPKSRPLNPASTARDLTIAATVQGVIGWLPIRGGGGVAPGGAGFGDQMRRNTGPDPIQAASSQAVSARTGHGAVWQ